MIDIPVGKALAAVERNETLLCPTGCSLAQSMCHLFDCHSYNRKDGKNVIFKLVDYPAVIKCAVCGANLADEYDDGGIHGHCPRCGRYLCKTCAYWENDNGETVCTDCWEENQ